MRSAAGRDRSVPLAIAQMDERVGTPKFLIIGPGSRKMVNRPLTRLPSDPFLTDRNRRPQ